MKRGKDDDKIIEPMFPRLHVNDTEKGGPRAPPRNKMALYEQLSIPSQRFNPGLLPLKTANSSHLSSLGSSSQGSDHERNLFFTCQVSSTATHVADKVNSQQHDRQNLNNSLAQLEDRNKVGDEDDFRVPIFVHSGTRQHSSKTQNCTDREKLTHLDPAYSGHSTRIQSYRDDDQKNVSSTGLSLRYDVINEGVESPEICISSSNHSGRSLRNLPSRDKVAEPEEEANASPSQEHGNCPVPYLSKFCKNDVCLQQEFTARSNVGGCGISIPERTEEVEKGDSPRSGSELHSREDLGSPNEAVTDSEHCGDKTRGSQILVDGDKSDDMSEISVVDSVSALDISPDDVAGIIGQKRFWEARTAIVNQQRLFAVQVFELHRLIKVQRLIAGSPHLLIGNSVYLGKPSTKYSPAKKLASDFVVTPPTHVPKLKDDTEKPIHRMECSAENAVGKTSLSSLKTGSQPSSHAPYSRNPKPVPVAADAKTNHCSYNQSVGHQWLIPVMSPSEGLIYKPYTGPGFMGSVSGGCGPFGPIPLPGNFTNPAYGVPAPHPPQGLAVFSGASPVCHGYFPPYGMPIMNPAISGSAVEQMNYCARSGSHGQPCQISGGGANFNLQHQSSCNVPTQKSGAVPQGMKFQTSKDTELQGSTASSPSERLQGVGTIKPSEGSNNALPLFPMAPAALEGAPQPQEMDQLTRVIRVVPHNPRSANESAARIFQSIQEERKQFDSV